MTTPFVLSEIVAKVQDEIPGIFREPPRRVELEILLDACVLCTKADERLSASTPVELTPAQMKFFTWAAG